MVTEEHRSSEVILIFYLTVGNCVDLAVKATCILTELTIYSQI